MINVLQLTEKQLKQMEQFYIDDLNINTNEYILFSVKSASINAYKSGKVVFQGKNATKEYDMWIKIFDMEQDIAEQEALFYSPSIGSDEVGKGDYFGPLVVCASYVDETHMNLIRDLRIGDSKARTDERIKTIAKQIIPKIPHSCLVLDNKKYNDLSKKGYSVVKMMAILHNKALLNVAKRVKKKVPVYIDQFTEPGVYYHYLNEEPEMYRNATFKTKAESKFSSVAVSSIIARYKYLEEMDKLSEQIGITLPKGGGDKVDQTIASIIKKEGESSLYSIGKIGFKNTEKAKKLL
jgi:ribonuclease HIII